MKKFFTFTGLTLLLAACGNSDPLALDSSVVTKTQPVITAVQPTTGAAGESIQILGTGFSIEASNNIVTLGKIATGASAYALLANPSGNSIESLTITVPTGATVGDAPVFVTVFDGTSNADIIFTVKP